MERSYTHPGRNVNVRVTIFERTGFMYLLTFIPGINNHEPFQQVFDKPSYNTIKNEQTYAVVFHPVPRNIYTLY